jgi:hypothetical protein
VELAPLPRTTKGDAAEYDRRMTIKAPCLHGEQIERDAAALLAEYAQARCVVIESPIPIEAIVEKHLKARRPAATVRCRF